MITIKKVDEAKAYAMYVNGERVEDEDVHLFRAFDGVMWVTVYDFEVCQKIMKFQIRDLDAWLGQMDFRIGYGFDGLREEFRIESSNGAVFSSFEYDMDIDEWKNPWSMREFGEEVEKIVQESDLRDGVFELKDEDVIGGFRVKFPVHDDGVVIEEEMDRNSDIVIDIIRTVEKNLMVQSGEGSIVALFKFSENTRVACEQYLLYFVQFLKDLGVDANSQLRHESEDVLFSVTPADGKEALEKIRQALEIYLRLPGEAGLQNPMNYGAEIEVQRLLANIQHLNGQLMLAQAIVQAKDATIEAKDITILRLTQGQIYLNSPPSQQEQKDKEDLLGGVVSLKPYEGTGFDINLPVIFRKLRDLFLQED
jgi:hypothetical protein